ncbi:MAG: fumarylacetoacetate hydrolase family protein, partial [Nocardioidaceae bacterium]
MRLGNLNDRAVIVLGNRAIDIGKHSHGQFSSDPLALLAEWAPLRAWASGLAEEDGAPFDWQRLGPPVPRPSQVFGIGLNYRDHALEAGLGLPDDPVVFTKFPSCVTGPEVQVDLPSSAVDWEVELVVVVSTAGHLIAAAEAWEHVAGFMVGQDLS